MPRQATASPPARLVKSLELTEIGTARAAADLAVFVVGVTVGLGKRLPLR